MISLTGAGLGTSVKKITLPSVFSGQQTKGNDMASKGRMINRDISASSGIAKLSPKGLALFCLVLPHLDSHGKMQAIHYTIKGTCCPLIDWLSVEEIGPLLEEISKHTSLKYFEHKGLHYLHSLNWRNHQKLRDDRLGEDRLPDYPVSLTTPGLRHPEVEVKGKVEAQVEGEKEEEDKHQGGSVKGETSFAGEETIESGLFAMNERLLEKRKIAGIENRGEKKI